MNRLASVIVNATTYTPGDLATDTAAAATTILPWVGAGVGGGLALMFAFLGIRKGIAFFKSVGR